MKGRPGSTKPDEGVLFARNVNITFFSAPQYYSFSIKKTSVSVL